MTRPTDGRRACAVVLGADALDLAPEQAGRRAGVLRVGVPRPPGQLGGSEPVAVGLEEGVRQAPRILRAVSTLGPDGNAERGAAMEKVEKTEEEWRAELTPEQYEILREAGTEPPFTGIYNDAKEDGTYRCAAPAGRSCSAPTPSSTPAPAGRASGTRWKTRTSITRPDNSLLMRRTEVLCARCGSHLGHVFDDGPQPTGQRYCINSCGAQPGRGMNQARDVRAHSRGHCWVEGIADGAPCASSTAGIEIRPSASWRFSMIAIRVRPTATAVPFSVCERLRRRFASAGR